MIQKWNILHLERRSDRVPISLANADIFGVPREKVGFWYAKDAVDFQDANTIIKSAVADGFTFFEQLHPESVKPGRLCQSWNVCRYLRDLADRESIEVLIHDGIILRGYHNHVLGFYPDFQWLCDAVEKCCNQPEGLLLLTIGDYLTCVDVDLIDGGSLISKRLGCPWNSVRVYSSEGARVILDRVAEIFSQHQYQVDDWFYFDINKATTWSIPGFYTILLQSIVFDMPAEYLGSDSNNWQSYIGVFKEIFEYIRK